MLKSDSTAEACSVAKDYVRDPIHILCFSPWQDEQEYDADLDNGVSLAVVLTILPTLFWWLVVAIMVFGTGFESDRDREITLALSIVSYSLFLIFCISFRTVMLDYPNDYPFLACLYSIQKVFEVYLLRSRRGRLASGELGVMLIVFQLVELLPYALIVGKYVLVKYFDHRRTKELANPTRATLNARAS